MTDDTLPLSPIGTVDDLLNQARQGAHAGAALDIVKETLTRQRDIKYRQMLNAQQTDRVLELRYELKAIEALAQDLLKSEARGEVARMALMDTFGGGDNDPEPVLRPKRVARGRSRKATRTTA